MSDKKNKNTKKKGTLMAKNEKHDPPEQDEKLQAESDAGNADGSESVEAETRESGPETIADLTEEDVAKIAEQAAKLPENDTVLDEAEQLDVDEAAKDAREAMEVAEREFRKYVKRDGGFRKGVSDKDMRACRRLQKRMGKTQLTWDQNILSM